MKNPLLRAVPLILLTAGPMTAAPLTLPAGATLIGTRTDTPARHALPVAAFDGAQVPNRIVTGTLDQRAWRLDGSTANTLALLQPLTDQLVAQGYKVIFTCPTTECGGFDFRFAVDVLPEPQMHVDLGDFYYLAAMNPAGDAVSLLTSRTADQGFIQITTVSPAADASVKGPDIKALLPPVLPAPDPVPPQTAAPDLNPPGLNPPDLNPPDLNPPDLNPPDPSQPAPKPAAPKPASAEPAPPDPLPPDPASPSPSPGDFDQALTTAGSVALDDLIFASGKADLLDQDYPSLAALSDWLKANPTRRVTLVGHTDATGTLVANIALSKQRAAAVRAWLIQRYDTRSTQIDAQGAGYLSPRATNQTPEGRSQNRRVEVMLTSIPAINP